MKIRIIMLFLLSILMFKLIDCSVKAEEYTSFEEIVFINEDVYLLDEFTSYDKAFLLNKMKSKMFGWNLEYKFKKEEFTFIAETLYHVRNNGLNNITHTFKYEESSESTVQRNVTGTLELSSTINKDTKAKEEKFKFGLEGEVEYEYKNTEKSKVSETDTVKIIIAPNTELYIKVLGKGYLSNGYARKYFFFIVVKEGGFEYTTITTEYYSIDMVIIDKDKENNVVVEDESDEEE